MFIVCLDLEGVLTPEVWINVAKKTGINELKLTTRDISDYDVLMKKRLRFLKDNNITLKDIQNIISGMDLLPGAKKFLDQLRSVTQVIILSDTFIEFAHKTFMKKLDYPVLLCHSLDVEKESGMIRDYKIRLKDHKRKTVTALKKMNYSVIAAGDSYNDTGMLEESDFGILFRPPENVIKEFPQFPVVTEYSDFKKLIFDYMKMPK